jgi:hypothetical protein
MLSAVIGRCETSTKFLRDESWPSTTNTQIWLIIYKQFLFAISWFYSICRVLQVISQPEKPDHLGCKPGAWLKTEDTLHDAYCLLECDACCLIEIYPRVREIWWSHLQRMETVNLLQITHRHSLENRKATCSHKMRNLRFLSEYVFRLNLLLS